MNRMRFIIYDDVVQKIQYTENNENYDINLDINQAHVYLKAFRNRYKNYIENTTSNNSVILDFYDVDVDLADEMMEFSGNNKIQRNKKNKKINRNNNIKRKVVAISATTLTILTILGVGASRVKELGSVNNLVKNVKNNFEEIDQTFKKIKEIKINNDNEIIEITDEKEEETFEEEKKDNLTKQNEIIDISPDNNTKESIDNTTKISISSDEIISQIIAEILSMPDDVKSEKNYDILSLNADNCTNTDKYKVAKAFYYETICNTAKTYGLDPNVVLAICTHERGLHNDVVDNGGGLGLFQIQVEGPWSWNNKTVKAYNFDNNSWENETITIDSARNVFKNIKYGCMILQTSMREQNYNIPRGIQSYNYGTTYMENVINACCNYENCTREDLNDQYNLSWLKYRNVIQNGDQNYLENVFKYIEDGTLLTFKTPNGETIEFVYENLNNQNTLK